MVTTLRNIMGLTHQPAPLSESALLMIDFQNTYRQGELKLNGVEAALLQAQKLLQLARKNNVPVIHIQHDGGAGSPYDLSTNLGAISEEVIPENGEQIIIKYFPNAFIQTSLDESLRRLSVENIIIAGFMTHMCINSTAHGAFNLGYKTTIVANTTATRDLEFDDGRIVQAQQVQDVTLATTRDLYAVIVDSPEQLTLS